jgi:hypothetical protein
MLRQERAKRPPMHDMLGERRKESFMEEFAIRNPDKNSVTGRNQGTFIECIDRFT